MMRRKKICWSIIVIFLVYVAVLLPKSCVLAETGDIATLLLDADPISISENTSFYFTPNESGGYALHMTADLKAEEQIGIRIYWYYWDENESLWIRDTYNDYYEQYDEELENYVFNTEYAHYLKGGVKYKIDADIFYNDGSNTIDIGMTESDAAGIYDGMIYRVDKDDEQKKYVTIVSYKGNAKEVTVPGEIGGYPVKVIGDGAFESCESIEKLCISENITTFENYPFICCTSLKTVELPSTLNNVNPQNCFGMCPITDITFPNGSNYGKYEDCALIINDVLLGYYGGDKEEYVIPEGVFQIGWYSFSNCSISTIKVPASVWFVSCSAFVGVSNLEHWYIENPACQIDSGSLPCIRDEETNTKNYTVKVHALSGGCVEKLCSDNGIPFESNGQMEKFIEAEVGKKTAWGVYSDGKAYCKFSPEEDGLYFIDIMNEDDIGNTSPAWTLPDITDEDGKVVASFAEEYTGSYVKLQKGKTYDIVWDSTKENYKCLHTICISKTSSPDTLSIIDTSINGEEGVCSLEIEKDTSVTLCVDAETRVKNSDLIYQWVNDKNEVLQEETENTFVIDSIGERTIYSCIVSDGFNSQTVFFSIEILGEDNPIDENWEVFDVSIKPVGEIVIGKEAFFDITIYNPSKKDIKTKVYNWYYRDMDNYQIYPGVEFGLIKNEAGEVESIMIPAGEKVELKLSGVIPETWGENSKILVVLADEEWRGQAGYQNAQLGKPESNHHFSTEWIIDKAATCTSPGSKSHHCTDEGCTEVQDVTVIPATGKHTYDSGVVTLEPTCTKKGIRTYTCTVCKHTKTEEIPATGFVKGGEFTKSNNTYTIKTVKGKKGTVVYDGPAKKAKKVIVPKTVKISGRTYTVTEISEGAFKDDTKLKSVIIPEGVTKIGKEAFSGCKNLKTITIKSTKLKSVGANAIKNINKKATIKVPKKQLSKYKKLFKSSTGYKTSMKIKK